MFEGQTTFYIIFGVGTVVCLGVLYWSIYVVVKWLEDTFGRGDHP